MSALFREDDLDRLRDVEKGVAELKVETAKQSVILERIDSRLARRDKWIGGIVASVLAGLILAWLMSHQPPARAENAPNTAALQTLRKDDQ